MLKRPHVDEFLQRMGELFECVLFTASLAKVSGGSKDTVGPFLGHCGSPIAAHLWASLDRCPPVHLWPFSVTNPRAPLDTGYQCSLLVTTHGHHRSSLATHPWPLLGPLSPPTH